MSFLRSADFYRVDSAGEKWPFRRDLYACDGCKREMSDESGFLDEGDGLHWCPFCAFKLGKITDDEFMGCRHWHGAGRNLRPIFNLIGEIEFIARRRSADPLKSPGLSKAKRFAVFERDRFRCRYCGAEPGDVGLHVDHVRPRADGGGNEADNLVTACSDCNLGKADRPLRPTRSRK